MKLRRRTKTREALLSAGRMLMATRLREGFSVEDIVAAAGVGKGSFYNYFADKDVLLDEIYRIIRTKEETEIGEVNASVREPAVRIARAMSVYARFALTSPDEARILTTGRLDALSIASATNAGLVADVTAGLNSGTLTTPSIEAAVLLVIGQTAVLMSRLRTIEGREAGDSLAQQCIALTLVGLGVERPAADVLSAQAVSDIVAAAGNGPTARNGA